MTTDGSLNYEFNKWKFQAQTWGEHVVYRNCFWQSEQFLYTTCSPHVLQKEELLTKIYLYRDDNFVIFNTCLEQVFECLKTILCWNGFGEQVELLKLALSHFANRSTKLDKDKYRSINISPPFFFWDTVEIQVKVQILAPQSLVVVLSCPLIGCWATKRANLRAAQNNY